MSRAKKKIYMWMLWFRLYIWIELFLPDNRRQSLFSAFNSNSLRRRATFGTARFVFNLQCVITTIYYKIRMRRIIRITWNIKNSILYWIKFTNNFVCTWNMREIFSSHYSNTEIWHSLVGLGSVLRDRGQVLLFFYWHTPFSLMWMDTMINRTKKHKMKRKQPR